MVNSNYEVINIDDWKRKFHYSIFKDNGFHVGKLVEALQQELTTFKYE